MVAIFDAISEPIAHRVSAGMTRVSQVLRTKNRAEMRRVGVTSAQAQTLTYLNARPSTLGQLAIELGVSSATASVAVATLVQKGLVNKRPGANKRTVALELTSSGRDAVARVGESPPSLADAIGTLDPVEQAALLASLVKVIRALQDSGELPAQRMCLSCTFFQPNIHLPSPEPHHCTFVDAAFGDRHLRLDCEEQEPASPQGEVENWERFSRTGD